MDMWDPYIASVREQVAEAEGKIVFDKFHVAKRRRCRGQGPAERA